MTTLHENFTPEYTLTAMLAGTCSSAVVPLLHGVFEASPKALTPIAVTLVGRLILVRLVQPRKTPVSIEVRLLGMTTLDKTVQASKA